MIDTYSTVFCALTAKTAYAQVLSPKCYSPTVLINREVRHMASRKASSSFACSSYCRRLVVLPIALSAVIGLIVKLSLGVAQHSQRSNNTTNAIFYSWYSLLHRWYSSLAAEGSPITVILAQFGVIAILLQIYFYVRFYKVSHQSALKCMFVFQNISSFSAYLARKLKALVLPLKQSRSTQTQQQVTKHEYCHHMLSSYGSWIIIANATFNVPWIVEFCNEIINIAFSPYRAQRQQQSNTNLSSSRRRSVTSRTKLNIMLVGEQHKKKCDSGKNGSSKDTQRNDIRGLVDIVTKRYREQLQLIRMTQNKEYQLDGEDEVMTIEYVEYPCYCDETKESPSATKVAAPSRFYDTFHNAMDTALGRIVLDGGLGLVVLCPPTMTSIAASSNEACSHESWQQVKLLRYIHDTTKMLHSAILPHMLFRNSGAILHLNSRWSTTLCGKADNGGCKNTTNSVNSETNVLPEHFRSSIAMKQILFNSVQAFQNQLIRSIHYEYKTQGIDCLSVQYDDIPIALGKCERRDNNDLNHPGDILHQSIMMFGKRAEASLTS